MGRVEIGLSVYTICSDQTGEAYQVCRWAFACERSVAVSSDGSLAADVHLHLCLPDPMASSLYSRSRETAWPRDLSSPPTRRLLFPHGPPSRANPPPAVPPTRASSTDPTTEYLSFSPSHHPPSSSPSHQSGLLRRSSSSSRSGSVLGPSRAGSGGSTSSSSPGRARTSRFPESSLRRVQPTSSPPGIRFDTGDILGNSPVEEDAIDEEDDHDGGSDPRVRSSPTPAFATTHTLTFLDDPRRSTSTTYPPPQSVDEHTRTRPRPRSPTRPARAANRPPNQAKPLAAHRTRPCPHRQRQHQRVRQPSPRPHHLSDHRTPPVSRR